MIRLFLLSLFITIPFSLYAQCGVPEFSILDETKLCRNSPIRLLNQDTQSISFYWDFCPENFSETPANQNVSLSGFSNGYGYKLVEENGQYHGFLTSRSLDKLFRLDFGDDPANAPTVVDLGNPGGLMDAPEGIDLYKDGNNWFAFVGKGENSTGQVVKFSFGKDLTSTPSATGYGTFGLGSIRIRDLSVVKQADDIILLLLIYNTASIDRVNFGASLDNSPGTNNLVTITGASLPRGIGMVTSCSPWRFHVVSENGLLQQVSFQNDILGSLTVEGGFTFSSVFQPWKVKSVFNRGRYYSIISNNGKKYSIIDFADLSLAGPPVEIANNNDVRFIGLDVVKYNGKNFLQGAGGTASLLSVSYQNSCGVQTDDYSYQKDPSSFTFAAAGNFGIDLTGYRDKNSFGVSSKEIQVMAIDAVEVQLSYSGMCQGNDVNFSNTSNELISSWSWDFGNGLFSSSSSPATVYSASGIYSVFLDAVGTNSCLTGNNIDILIYDAPQAEFVIPPSLLCTNNAFTFATTTPDVYDGNLSYQWLVDNAPAGMNRDLEYTFTTTGPKDIKLITAIPGCSNEITKTTSAVEAGPVVDFSYAGICEDETFSFQSLVADPVEGYLWDFGNGQTSTNANGDQVFNAFGDYDVSLTATNAIGCQNKKMKTIAVHGKPVVSFMADGPPNACSGNPVLFVNQTTAPAGDDITEWLWEFHDPNEIKTDSRKDPEHVFAVAAPYTVALSATTGSGCSDIFEKEISVYPSPSADFTAGSVCDDIPVSFSATGSDISAWYWEIGTSYYTIAAPSHTFRSPGDYPLYLGVTGSNGCLSSVKTVMHVPVPLVPEFSSVKNCVGQEAVLTDITTGADPVQSREWIFSTGETFYNSPVKYVFNQEGNRTIAFKVTAESGCTYEISKVLAIRPAPVAAFSADPSSGSYPLDVRFTNTSSDATQYFWKFNDDAGATSNEESPAHTFIQAGSYGVELTAVSDVGCEASFQSSVTAVAPLPDADIEMIALTPNADGSLRLIATIHNKGNTILKDLPLQIDFDGTVELQQTVEESIPPASKYNFVFNSGITDAANLRYICVSIDLENDLHPEGNRMCRELEHTLFVFPAFPNPTSGLLNLEWITEGKNSVRISLTDALGRNIMEMPITGAGGLNHRTLDLSGLQNGVYNLLIEDGAAKNRQRILISGKP